MTDDQKNQYSNLFRWYKHVQNLAEIKEFLEKNQRFLVKDPEVKVPFVQEKKKDKKKDKKELKIEVPSEEGPKGDSGKAKK